MGSLTARLKLFKPDPTENVDVNTQLNGNYDLIDSFAPNTACVQAARPSSPFPGQKIYETDTGYERIWNGRSSHWEALNAISVLSTDVRPAGALLGDRILELDTGIIRYWNGTSWRPLGKGLAFKATIGANLDIASGAPLPTQTDLFGAWPLTVNADGLTSYNLICQLGGWQTKIGGVAADTDTISIAFVTTQDNGTTANAVVSAQACLGLSVAGDVAAAPSIDAIWTPAAGTYQIGVKAGKIRGAGTLTVVANSSLFGTMRVEEY